MTNTPTPNEVLTELAGILHKVPESHRDILIKAVANYDQLVEALQFAMVYIAENPSDKTGDRAEIFTAVQSALEKVGAL